SAARSAAAAECRGQRARRRGGGRLPTWFDTPEIRSKKVSGLGNDQLQALEIVAVECRVEGDQAVALHQRVRTDQEIGDGPGLGATLALAPLHLAGAQGRLGLDRTEMHAHLFHRGEHIGAVAQRGTQLRQGRVAQHHAPAGQALAQAGLDRVCPRTVGQQLDQDRRVDRDHPSFLLPGSSANLPRTRESASSTLLRRMMRLPSSSTLSTLPLVNPSASRTALGRVIWPRSATVASIDGSHAWDGMDELYILHSPYPTAHTVRTRSATVASR